MGPAISAIAITDLPSRACKPRGGKSDYVLSARQVTLRQYERGKTMKTLLAIAAALGLSISAASAECPGHSKVQASVDTQTKTASVAPADTATTADTQTIKKAQPPETE